MIEKLFQQTRAPFVVVRNQHLHIGDQVYEQLKVYIHEVTPVRKLFNDGRLKCYSLDCRTAKNSQLCELWYRRFISPERRRFLISCIFFFDLLPFCILLQKFNKNHLLL